MSLPNGTLISASAAPHCGAVCVEENTPSLSLWRLEKTGEEFISSAECTVCYTSHNTLRVSMKFHPTFSQTCTKILEQWQIMKSGLQTWSKHCRLLVHQHGWFWLPEESVSKIDIIFFLMDFTLKNCFSWLSRAPTWKLLGARETPFFTLIISMCDSGLTGMNFVGIWLWIVMPPRRKLSILNRGRVLTWLNDSVRNCR